MARKSYKTVGAISGHFLSKGQRKANASASSNTEGAIQARALDAAELEPAAAYLGKCPACDTHVYARGAVAALSDCLRCEMYRADPSMALDTDGTWMAIDDATDRS